MIKLFMHPLERRPIWSDGDSFPDFLTHEAAPAIARRHVCSFGGGKTTTSTGSQSGTTSAPQFVQDWASSAFAKAQGAANQPFTPYSGEFVAPVNAQQSTGIAGINNAAGTYAPYAGAAAGTLNAGLGAGQALTAAGSGAANPGALDINQYMSPYVNDVVNSTLAQLRQQQGQEQSTLGGNAIQAGAFGGDRGGVAAANLANQQNMATASTASGLYNQAYNNALGTAQQQQGVGLSAQQANLARFLQGGSQLFNQGLSGAQGIAGLGTQEQANQLGVANAQVGAGTLQQQTQQQQDAAQYNQFLQQQAYPFQTSQFLINALQGLGPIYGTQTNSTGTQTQPASFFNAGGRVGLAAGGSPWSEADAFWRDHLDRIGLAGGGVSDDAVARLYPWLASKGSAGPYGTEIAQHGGSQMPQAPRPIEFRAPERRGLGDAMAGVNRAVDFGKNAADGYKAARDAMVGTRPVLDASGKVLKPGTDGWFGTGGVWGSVAPASNSGLGSASSVTTLDPSGALSRSTASTLDPSGVSLDPTYQSGGRVGLAYGGMPYADQTSDPIVPRDISDPLRITDPLAAAGGLGSLGGMGQQQKPQSGLSQAGNAASSIGNIIKLGSTIASFFNAGGRVGKDGGGAMDAPDPVAEEFPRIIREESRGLHYKPNGDPLTSPKGATGIAQVMPTTAPEAAKLAGVDWNPELFSRKRTGDAAANKEAEDYNRKLGEAYYREQRHAFGDPMIAAAAYNAGPQAVRDAQQKAATQGGSYLDYLPKETQSYVMSLGPGISPAGGVGLSAKPADLAANAPSQASDPQALAGAVAQVGAAAAPHENFWDKESGGLSGKERGIISLLTGLGGMASSNSRFLGSALLQGLGAGAQTYGSMAQKGKELDISQGRLGIEQTAKNIEVYNILRERAGAYIRTGQPVPAELKAQLDRLAASLAGSGANVGAGLSTQPVIPRQPQSAPTLASHPGSLSGQGIPDHTPTIPVTQQPLPPPTGVTLPDGTPIADEPQKPAFTDNAPRAAPGTEMHFDPLAKYEAPPLNVALDDPEFRAAIGPDRDPIVMRQKANAMAEYDSKGAKELWDRAQATEDNMKATGTTLDKNDHVIPVPRWAEQKAANDRVGENQKWADQQATDAMARAQARTQLDEIRKVLETYESGSLAGKKAQVQALARSLGMGGLLPGGQTMDAAAYETFMKSALRNVFANVKDMGGRPLVSEIEGFKGATANPELQPDANREILAQLYGALNQADKYYGDTARVMAKNKALDRSNYTADWQQQKENQLPGMVDAIRKDIGVRGGTPPLNKMKEGHVYIVEPGQFPGYPAGKYRAITKADGTSVLRQVLE